MAHADVVAAVHQRLAANWTKCPVKDDENTTEQQAPAETALPLLMVLFPLTNATGASVGDPGNNVWREEGAFVLVLQLERGQGAKPWLPWMDELAALFRGKSFAGVETGAPSSAAVAGDNDDGQLFELRVAVPYEFDLIG